MAFLSVSLSPPAFVIYSSANVSVPNEYGIELHGLGCTPTRELSFKTIHLTFIGVLLMLFVLFTTILIVIYFIIGRKISVQKKNPNHKPAIKKEDPGFIMKITNRPSTTDNLTSDTAGEVKVQALKERISQRPQRTLVSFRTDIAQQINRQR